MGLKKMRPRCAACETPLFFSFDDVFDGRMALALPEERENVRSEPRRSTNSPRPRPPDAQTDGSTCIRD